MCTCAFWLRVCFHNSVTGPKKIDMTSSGHSSLYLCYLVPAVGPFLQKWKLAKLRIILKWICSQHRLARVVKRSTANSHLAFLPVTQDRFLGKNAFYIIHLLNGFLSTSKLRCIYIYIIYTYLRLLTSQAFITIERWSDEVKPEQLAAEHQWRSSGLKRRSWDSCVDKFMMPSFAFLVPFLERNCVSRKKTTALAGFTSLKSQMVSALNFAFCTLQHFNHEERAFPFHPPANHPHTSPPRDWLQPPYGHLRTHRIWLQVSSAYNMIVQTFAHKKLMLWTLPNDFCILTGVSPSAYEPFSHNLLPKWRILKNDHGMVVNDFKWRASILLNHPS